MFAYELGDALEPGLVPSYLMEVVDENLKLMQDFEKGAPSQCYVCQKRASDDCKLKQCTGCAVSYYCSRECQLKDSEKSQKNVYGDRTA